MMSPAKVLGFAAANMALVILAGCASETPKPVSPSANVCPPWVNSPEDSHSNADSAYLGCVNAMNLAHMAEDPNDLKHGRDLGPADGATQANAVKNYEQDKVKKSESPATSQVFVTPVVSGSGAGGQ